MRMFSGPIAQKREIYYPVGVNRLTDSGLLHGTPLDAGPMPCIRPT